MRKDEEPPATLASVISAGWFRHRNRLFSNPRFQRWAAAFPLTRPIARRRASALFELCAGFVYSQVLYAVVRLGVLDIVMDEPCSVSQLATALSLTPENVRTLADAAVALKLLELRPGRRYGLGIHGASLVGNPSVASMIEHHALLYRDLEDPVALLRGAATTHGLRRFWSYESDPHAKTDAEVEPYTKLMSSSMAMLVEDILEAYPMHNHQRLLDVCGGDGTFLEAAATKARNLSLLLFDLPPVAERANARFVRAGLSARATAIGGDVFRDPLPSADLVSLVRVVHDHDDPHALDILRAVRAAMLPGGRVLIAEPMASFSHAQPSGHAYFGFYLLALGQGRPRTPQELRALLKEAGFEEIRELPTRRPLLAQLIVATAS